MPFWNRLTKMQPAYSEKTNGDLKSAICKSNVAYGSFPGNLDGCYRNFGQLCDGICENGVKQEREAEGFEPGALAIASNFPLKDPLDLSMTFPAPVKSDRDVKLSSRSDSVPSASFSRNRDDIKLSNRDDEEKISRLNKQSNRRKLFYRSSIVTCGDGIGSGSVSNSPEKVKNENKSSSGEMSHGACEISSLVTSHQASYKSNDSHVKLSIKSFRIPELYIEVPETATVGSVKRTVMEAVTALLGGRIRVGVLLQGKKVRDDSRTLSQTGISSEDNLDALGFTLEPGPVITPPPLCSEEPPLLLPCGAAPQNLTSFRATPDPVTKIATADPPLLTNSAKATDSNYKHTSSQTDILTDQKLTESRALVPVQETLRIVRQLDPALLDQLNHECQFKNCSRAWRGQYSVDLQFDHIIEGVTINVEALAVVPANQKIRKSELAQRRTRRPFSVSEVEALVQAVEVLSTGRVMAAHAYWSQHQAKQHGKNHTGTLRITDSQANRNGVAVAIPTISM
ncbi:Telomeric DNA binding protein 1, putative isoform 2 [Hibiscus syriacus]|uniref:Telomeric DNA binding protein 1, putative isoform 2 n=1 Tax=Hibiscus syriacus TaxID=106335 RepID=A0A6A2YKV6_HIBSY|nr:Telomeric DNA binding protein 1, putative isoform 2 [Hibiscus syriacus]